MERGDDVITLRFVLEKKVIFLGSFTRELKYVIWDGFGHHRLDNIQTLFGKTQIVADPDGYVLRFYEQIGR